MVSSILMLSIDTNICRVAFLWQFRFFSRHSFYVPSPQFGDQCCQSIRYEYLHSCIFLCTFNLLYVSFINFEIGVVNRYELLQSCIFLNTFDFIFRHSCYICKFGDQFRQSINICRVKFFLGTFNFLWRHLLYV